MIQEDKKIQEAKNYSERLLARYPRTISEIKNKLKKKNYSDEITELTIQYFIENNILSDENYAKEWIESQLRNRPTSRIMCRKKMFQKGLSREIIDRHLDEFYSPEKEEEVAYSLAIKKIRKINENSSDKKKMKVGRYLDSKGFPESVIWSVLEKMSL
jgi:regulatory protein